MSEELSQGKPGEAGRRERLLEAMLESATSAGYEATTVEMVCAEAEVAPGEFEAEFESLEECALVLLESFFEPIRDRAWAVYEAQGRWPDSLRAASWEVADWIEAHPREVRFGAIELPKVGEIGQVRFEAAFKTFVPMIDAGREVSGKRLVPRLTGERVVGSLATILRLLLRRGGPLEAHRHMRELMCVAVLPYLGPAAAARELKMPRPAAEVGEQKRGARLQ